MQNKVFRDFDEAVADIPNGSTVMIPGFAGPGTPRNLIAALLRQGAKDLTAISNHPGAGPNDGQVDLGALVEAGRIKKIYCSFTAAPHPTQATKFEKLYNEGAIEGELLPQGTLAERIKIWPFFVFAAVLTAFIYPIEMGWQWGGGFLSTAGFSDFAGSTLVHSAGGSAALAGAIILGPRLNRFTNGQAKPLEPYAASSIPLATLGVFVLWLGWFGFNGGSQLALASFDDVNAISTIFINTNLAACAGVVVNATLTRLVFGKTDVIQMLNGALGGLVAITAEPLLPSPFLAILIGGIGGAIVVFGSRLLIKLQIDDVVGAIPVHLFAGIWGTLAVVISNPDASLGAQIIGIFAVNIFVFIASFIVWFAMKQSVGIRISEEAEKLGTDKVEIGVMAYMIRD